MALTRYLLIGSALLWCGGASAAEIGEPAPTFELPALQGEGRVALESFRGRVVLLDFWASWCAPCRKSLPLYEQMYHELAGEGLTVVAVNLDEEPAEGIRFLELHPVSYPVAKDPAATVAMAYGLKAMPMSYLIDRDGRVIDLHLGFRPSDIEPLRRSVEDALAQDGSENETAD